MSPCPPWILFSKWNKPSTVAFCFVSMVHQKYSMIRKATANNVITMNITNMWRTVNSRSANVAVDKKSENAYNFKTPNRTQDMKSLIQNPHAWQLTNHEEACAVDCTCWAWIHGDSYVTPIVYLHWLFVNYANALSCDCWAVQSAALKSMSC